MSGTTGMSGTVPVMAFPAGLGVAEA
jgi:hypothetical protein